MKLLEGPFEGWPSSERRRAVTIGVYDGVHRGHRHVIMRLGDRAERGDMDLTVVTFRNHPATVLAPDRVPPQLTTLEQRVELFGELGVEWLALLDFDERVRRLSPEAFVGDVLVDALGVDDEEVVVLRVKSRIRAGNYCDIRRACCDIS